jgi:uncharacterized protein YcbK (DUF882 family)
MKLSPHFHAMEFACACRCGFGLNPGDVDPLLVASLEALRADLCGPLYINSGCRCEFHNKSVGGAETSQHLHGKAADVYGFPPEIIREAALRVEAFNNGGIGFYPVNGFVHLDVRAMPARWTG